MTGEQVIEELKRELASYGMAHLLDGVDLSQANTLPTVNEKMNTECALCGSMASTGRIVIPQHHLGEGNYSYICLDRATCRQRALKGIEQQNKEAAYKLASLAKYVKPVKRE